MDKRVVVTGMGVISPVGNNVEEFWKNILDGVCGIDFITEFPTDDLPAKVAGEVKDFKPADYGIEPAFARKQDKFSVFAVAAANEAIRQSGLSTAEDGGNIDASRFGVYVGSGIGGFSTQYKESEKMIKDGAKWISPLFIPTMIANMAAGNIAIRHNLCGPCVPVVTACATSTHTIGEASARRTAPSSMAMQTPSLPEARKRPPSRSASQALQTPRRSPGQKTRNMPHFRSMPTEEVS